MSATIAGLISAILAVIVGSEAVDVPTTEELEATIATVWLLGSLLVSWWGRVRKGDVTWWGKRKNSR